MVVSFVRLLQKKDSIQKRLKTPDRLQTTESTFTSSPSLPARPARYWTFKNSWSDKWADGGFARFLRGADLCGIESDVHAGCVGDCVLTDGVKPNMSWVPPAQAGAAVRPQQSRRWRGGSEHERGGPCVFGHALDVR